MEAPRGNALQPTVLASVRRHPGLVAAVVGLCALLGLAFALVRGPSATAEASIVVEDPRSFLNDAGRSSDTYVADQIEILQLDVTVERAVALLEARGLRSLTVRSYEKAVVVAGREGTNLITVSFTDREPEVARASADALYNAYREVLRGQVSREQAAARERINQAIAQYDAQLARLPRDDVARASLTEARSAQVERLAQLFVSDDPAALGIKAYSPPRLPRLDSGSPAKTAVLGALLGLLPAATLAYVVAQRRRRFTDRFQPELLLGQPLLTEVPLFSAERLPSDVPAADVPGSSAAESFRFLSSSVGVQAGASRLRVLAIVSASSLDGKTTVAANLAVTAAQQGLRVLAVDADLDGQGLGFLLLGQDRDGPGLVQVMQGRATVEQAVQIAADDLPGLHVLPGGRLPRSPLELFSSTACRELFAGLAERYDLVVVDVPPVLQIAYASPLVLAADGAAVVVSHQSPVSKLEELADRLSFLDVPVAGYVYNKAPLRRELGRHSRLVTEHRRRPAAQALPHDGEAGARPDGDGRAVQAVLASPPPEEQLTSGSPTAHDGGHVVLATLPEATPEEPPAAPPPPAPVAEPEVAAAAPAAPLPVTGTSVVPTYPGRPAIQPERGPDLEPERDVPHPTAPAEQAHERPLSPVSAAAAPDAALGTLPLWGPDPAAVEPGPNAHLLAVIASADGSVRVEPPLAPEPARAEAAQAPVRPTSPVGWPGAHDGASRRPTRQAAVRQALSYADLAQGPVPVTRSTGGPASPQA